MAMDNSLPWTVHGSIPRDPGLPSLSGLQKRSVTSDIPFTLLPHSSITRGFRITGSGLPNRVRVTIHCPDKSFPPVGDPRRLFRASNGFGNSWSIVSPEVRANHSGSFSCWNRRECDKTRSSQLQALLTRSFSGARFVGGPVVGGQARQCSPLLARAVRPTPTWRLDVPPQ